VQRIAALVPHRNGRLERSALKRRPDGLLSLSRKVGCPAKDGEFGRRLALCNDPFDGRREAPSHIDERGFQIAGIVAVRRHRLLYQADSFRINYDQSRLRADYGPRGFRNVVQFRELW
jgi:hypothetical protein